MRISDWSSDVCSSDLPSPCVRPEGARPMVDEASTSPEERAAAAADAPHGAVIAGAVPGQSPRVLIEAARYARLLSAPLAIVHVDVTRFVTFEDPDGFVHSDRKRVG